MQQTLNTLSARRHRQALSGSSILYRAACASLVIASFVPMDALALPTGAQVEAGSISISQPSATDLVINQGSDRAIINWQNFDILHGESTRFIQPGSDSIALNRIVAGQNATQILGSLSANGKVILVNPNGVFFGVGSKVDVGGLIASTADISSTNFLNNKLVFDKAGAADARIVNGGTITAAEGGLVALIAPGVENNGIIQANAGTVALASGTSATIDLYGDNLYSFTVGKTTKDAGGVSNTGAIKAQGGKVLLTANAAKDVVTNVVNNTGVIEASAARVVGGTVVLDGGESGKVNVAGTINASGKSAGQQGGSVTVIGNSIQLASATIDASGATAGGSVRIGGDYQGGGSLAHAANVAGNAGSLINVSAIDAGNGGSAVIWSDLSTEFGGTILGSAGAAGGNGGFAEVSSKGDLSYSGLADLHGVNGAAGELLLDPTNVNVDAALAASTVASLDLGTNVTITTSAPGPDVGNITVNSAINWTGTGSLTLNADNNIVVNKNITSANNGGSSLGALTLQAVKDVTFNNAVVSTASGFIDIIAKKISLLGSSISALAGDITLSNTGAFFSNTANAISNDATLAGAININQTSAGSIQNAVDAIGTRGTGGATINLASGTWNEQVHIDKDMTALVGQGASTVIKAPAGVLNTYVSASGAIVAPVVFIENSNGVILDSLRINANQHATTGVAFSNQNLSALYTVDVINSAGNGVYVDGSNGTFIIDALINNTQGNGITILNSPNTFVVNSLIGVAGRNTIWGPTGNIQGDGIYADNADDLVIVGNRINQTASTGTDIGNGIYVKNSDFVTIGAGFPGSENIISNVAWDGIKLNNVNDVEVAGSSVTTAARIGLEASSVTDGLFLDNHFTYVNNSLNGFGAISVDGGSDFIIDGNGVYMSGNGSGIRLTNVGGLNDVDNNRLHGLPGNGIEAFNLADLSAVGNSISSAKIDGIHLEDIGDANLEDNYLVTIGNNGISLNNITGSTNLDGNFVKSAVDGIHITNAVNTTITNSTISDVSGDGIFASNLSINGIVDVGPSLTDPFLTPDQQYLLNHHRITDISGNNVTTVGRDGIHLESIENAHLFGNTTQGATRNGIDAFDLYTTARPQRDYRTVFDGNVSFNNGNDGIHLASVQNATLLRSNLHDVDGNGLFLSNTGAQRVLGNGDYNSAFVAANTVYNADADGIRVENITGAHILFNVHMHDIGQAAIHVLDSAKARIHDNLLTASGSGITLEGSDAAHVYDNRLTNNGVGVQLLSSNSGLLEGNVFTGNALGINLDGSTDTFISANTLNIPQQGVGLRITNGSSGTLVENTAFNGGNVAVDIDGFGSDMQFVGNGSVFTGNNFYFVLQNGAMAGDVLDASQQIFDGTRAIDFTPAQLADAETNHTIDAEDDVTLGDVFYTAFPPTPFALNLSVLDDFQNSRRNVYRRGNFSYAGRSMNFVVDPIETGSFDPKTAQLSLLNRVAPTAAADVANLFSNLAPAAGGKMSAQQLAGLAPAAGGTPSAEQLASLAPAAGGAAGSCANNFLGDGFNSGFSCSAQ